MLEVRRGWRKPQNHVLRQHMVKLLLAPSRLLQGGAEGVPEEPSLLAQWHWVEACGLEPLGTLQLCPVYWVGEAWNDFSFSAEVFPISWEVISCPSRIPVFTEIS